MVLFLRSLSVLTARNGKRSSTRVNLTMLGITVSLFCLLTAHLGIQISRAFDAFIYPPTTYIPTPGAFAVPIPSYTGSVISYDTLSNPKYITNEAIWVLAGSITDSFLVSSTLTPQSIKANLDDDRYTELSLFGRVIIGSPPYR